MADNDRDPLLLQTLRRIEDKLESIFNKLDDRVTHEELQEHKVHVDERLDALEADVRSLRETRIALSTRDRMVIAILVLIWTVIGWGLQSWIGNRVQATPPAHHADTTIHKQEKQ